MTDCIHLKLSKLADTMFKPFASFKEGYRFYRCENCGQLLKVKTTSNQGGRWLA